MKIIAVDFDGTLCQSNYPELGEPIQLVIDKLLLEQLNGAKIILWTCRRAMPCRCYKVVLRTRHHI